MKSLGVFIFPGVQTLDLFGPIEMLGAFPDQIALTLVAESSDPVPTRHGHRVIPEATIEDGTQYDLLLIPGGDSAIEAGRRDAANNWLGTVVERAELVMTVCTGCFASSLATSLD